MVKRLRVPYQVNNDDDSINHFLRFNVVLNAVATIDPGAYRYLKENIIKEHMFGPVYYRGSHILSFLFSFSEHDNNGTINWWDINSRLSEIGVYEFVALSFKEIEGLW